MGKSIDESAYVSTDHLRSVYLRAMPTLLINGNGLKAKKLMELENALKSVESENATLKTRVDQLQKTIVELESGQKTMQKTIMNMDADIAQIKEKLNIKEKVRID